MLQFYKFIFGEKYVGKLPARVLEKINQQQQSAEKLIGWVQLSSG